MLALRGGEGRGRVLFDGQFVIASDSFQADQKLLEVAHLADILRERIRENDEVGDAQCHRASVQIGGHQDAIHVEQREN